MINITIYFFIIFFTAPPAFKLKKSPKRSLVSRSPFSTDRVYDLPKGKGLNIKKSDKPPTQFKEFRNVDASWKVILIYPVTINIFHLITRCGITFVIYGS